MREGLYVFRIADREAEVEKARVEVGIVGFEGGRVGRVEGGDVRERAEKRELRRDGDGDIEVEVVVERWRWGAEGRR